MLATHSSYIIKKPKIFWIRILLRILRRKYELLEFLDSNEQMICCYLNNRSASSSNSSSSSHCSSVEKKQYDKQATRHRIGHAFRNSWGRKESDHKQTKKSNSLVMISGFLNAIYITLRIMILLFLFAVRYQKKNSYCKLLFLSNSVLYASRCSRICTRI